MNKLKFISDKDLKTHVADTVNDYIKNLTSHDIKKFNKNVIDPVKLIFDKKVYGADWSDVIKNEIFRQIDKANNNSIGYFHQNIFNYIKNCKVPDENWDIIFKSKKSIEIDKDKKVKKIYVELKNKHNTMNSSSSAEIYRKMLEKIHEEDDCACFLVEVIATKSQNKPWSLSLKGKKEKHKRIRRVSIDEFYKIVTGEDDAFYQLCMILPSVIEEVISNSTSIDVPKDTVFDELNDKAISSFELALYKLAFESYIGFKTE